MPLEVDYEIEIVTLSFLPQSRLPRDGMLAYVASSEALWMRQET